MIALLALLAGPLQSPAFSQSQGAPPLPVRFQWIDRDRDGDQDVLALDPAGRLRLLENDGRGVFEDATARLGLAEAGPLTTLLAGDCDLDGTPDLVLGDAAGVRLWRGVRGGFEPVDLGAELAQLGPVESLGWVDVHGNGRPDLHVLSRGVHRVFANEPGLLRELQLGLGESALELPRFVATEVHETGKDPEPPAAPVAGALHSNAPSLALEPALGSEEHDHAMGAFGVVCTKAVDDLSSPGNCIPASSVPMEGVLFPLGVDLFVDAATGNVGMGTTTPGYALEVIGTIVSGTGNSAPGAGAAIGGGSFNVASGEHATIAGGESNQALTADSFIGGGNSNLATGQRAVIGGGVGNRAANSATVGGGETNAAQFGFSTIAGGRFNDVEATYGAVGGGQDNLVSGAHGVVPGGLLNTAAGAYSLAAGRRAKALHAGAFVWADSADADLASTAPNQFVVRASGGVGLGKVPDPAFQLDVEGALRAKDTITSSKTSGAPFQVASSDRNVNLNADLLDGFHASAFSMFGPLVDGFELADGAVSAPKIAVDAIADAHVASAAAIAGTKIAPNFGAQDLVTTGRVAIGTSTLGEQLTVAGVIESTDGGIRFPDGSLQATAQVAGPAGPGGPAGPPGQPGPAGPPGSTEPAEPTGALGTWQFEYDGQFSGRDLYGFEQRNVALTGVPGSPLVPELTLTLELDGSSPALHDAFADFLVQPSGDGEFLVTLDVLGHPSNPGAVLTLTGLDFMVTGIATREHASGTRPRVDVVLVARVLTWSFADGNGGTAQGAFSFDPTGGSVSAWQVQPYPMDPLQYLVLGYPVPGHASLPDEYELAYDGELRAGRGISLDGVLHSEMKRAFELEKPLGLDSFTNMAHGYRFARFGVVASPAVAVGFEYRNQDQTTARYDLEGGVASWRIESRGGLLLEVLTFANLGPDGLPASGSLNVGNESSSW